MEFGRFRGLQCGVEAFERHGKGGGYNTPPEKGADRKTIPLKEPSCAPCSRAFNRYGSQFLLCQYGRKPAISRYHQWRITSVSWHSMLDCRILTRKAGILSIQIVGILSSSLPRYWWCWSCLMLGFSMQTTTCVDTHQLKGPPFFS